MLLIGNFFSSVVRITCCGSSVRTNGIFDSFGTTNSLNGFGTNVLVAFLGSFLKLEINGIEETRRKLKNLHSLVICFSRMTSSEVLVVLVSRFLCFPSRQNGHRNNIGSMDQIFMKTGWHVEPRVFSNK
jgi:hypothetical protein